MEFFSSLRELTTPKEGMRLLEMVGGVDGGR